MVVVPPVSQTQTIDSNSSTIGNNNENGKNNKYICFVCYYHQNKINNDNFKIVLIFLSEFPNPKKNKGIPNQDGHKNPTLARKRREAQGARDWDWGWSVNPDFNSLRFDNDVDNNNDDDDGDQVNSENDVNYDYV